MLPRIKLIAIDVDGTLIGSSKKPSERVKEAIKAALSAGCEIVLSTGRSRYTMRPIMHELDLNGPVILFGGAVVLHWGNGDIWHRVLMPKELVKDVVAVMRSYGIGAVIMADGTESDCVVAERLLPPTEQYIQRNRERLEWVEDMTKVVPFEPATVAGIGNEEVAMKCIQELREQFKESLSIAVSYSVAYGGWVVEVHHRDGNKGKALKLVAEKLRVKREQVMAIGDNLNDIDMLVYAGFSVAMANSPEAVKQIADEVVPSADEDGVAHAIYNFVLQDTA